MKEIDIKEIIEKHWQEYCKNTDYEYFEEAIKDAVNKALDIASEEVLLDYVIDSNLDPETEGNQCVHFNTDNFVSISKPSILDIKNRVK